MHTFRVYRGALPILLLAACDRQTEDSGETGTHDNDADGYAWVDGDCDDFDASVHPGASESCDGVDQDCDGDADDDVRPIWYRDADGDGAGRDDEMLSACQAPAGWSPRAGDCDDGDPARSPTFDETPYDGIDNDCDPATPDDDLDRDGFSVAEDCDDDDPLAWPGAPEIWYDGVDEDCAGGADWDADGDGFELGDDCDDEDAEVFPGGIEALGDDRDGDCDGNEDATSWRNPGLDLVDPVGPSVVSGIGGTQLFFGQRIQITLPDDPCPWGRWILSWGGEVDATVPRREVPECGTNTHELGTVTAARAVEGGFLLGYTRRIGSSWSGFAASMAPDGEMWRRFRGEHALTDAAPEGTRWALHPAGDLGFVAVSCDGDHVGWRSFDIPDAQHAKDWSGGQDAVPARLCWIEPEAPTAWLVTVEPGGVYRRRLVGNLLASWLEDPEPHPLAGVLQAPDILDVSQDDTAVTIALGPDGALLLRGPTAVARLTSADTSSRTDWHVRSATSETIDGITYVAAIVEDANGDAEPDVVLAYGPEHGRLTDVVLPLPDEPLLRVERVDLAADAQWVTLAVAGTSLTGGPDAVLWMRMRAPR